MKRLIFTLFPFLIFASAIAQIDIKQAMRGENGVSRHFTVLDNTLSVSFNPGKAKATFGLDVNSDLVLKDTETDPLGMTHYRYYQSYRGIPVENTMYVVHTRQDKLT